MRSFAYNLDNRLTQVKDASSQTIASYQYDPFGQRIAKTINGSTQYFYYADEGLVAELSSSGQVTTAYGYWPNSAWGTKPLFIQQNSKTGYYQNDHLGTPQQIIDSSGAVLWSAHYSAFGEASITQSSINNNLRFPGQYFDSETQLHYNYFRYYDPEMGRYVTSDPIGLAGGVNAYGYVGGNPVQYADPTGLICIPNIVIGAISGALAGAVTGGLIGLATGNPIAGLAVGGAVGGVTGAVSSDYLTGQGESIIINTLISTALGGPAAGLESFITQGVEATVSENTDQLLSQMVGPLFSAAISGTILGVTTQLGSGAVLASMIGALVGIQAELILQSISDCKAPKEAEPSEPTFCEAY